MVAEEEQQQDDRLTEQELLCFWKLERFLSLGFPPSMADDLVEAGVNWRDAERVLAKDPPGGFPWVFWYLMPEPPNSVGSST